MLSQSLPTTAGTNCSSAHEQGDNAIQYLRYIGRVVFLQYSIVSFLHLRLAHRSSGSSCALTYLTPPIIRTQRHTLHHFRTTSCDTTYHGLFRHYLRVFRHGRRLDVNIRRLTWVHSVVIAMFIAAVLPDSTDDPLESVPMDFDHPSSGFAAYCVIA